MTQRSNSQVAIRQELVAAVAILVAGVATGLLSWHLRGAPSSGQHVAWLHAGVLAGLLVHFGMRFWPVVVVSTVTLGLLMGRDPRLAASLGIGDALEAVIAALVVTRVVHLSPQMHRLRDAIALVVATPVVSAFVGATAGFLGALAFGEPSGPSGLATWLDWYLGHVAGMVVALPMTTVWLAPRDARLGPASRYEASLIVGLTALAGVCAFIQPFGGGTHDAPLAYLPIPFLVWAAIRLEIRSTAGVTCMFAMLALAASRFDRGPFTPIGDDTVWLIATTYLAMTGGMTLVLASAITERRSALADRDETEERNRLIVDAAGEGVALVDKAGCVTFANRRLAGLLGHGPDGLIGRRLGDFFDRRDRDVVCSMLALDGAHRSPGREEFQLRRRDGRYIRVVVSIRESSAEPSRSSTSIVLVTDVTEQRRSEEEAHERFQRLERHRAALVRLSTHPALGGGDFDRFTQIAARFACDALNAGRAGVWMLSDDGRHLTCHSSYRSSTGEFQAGTSLSADQYPEYFRDLCMTRTLVVNDVAMDPQVREFNERLGQVGVTAVLDAPIRMSGMIVGVLRVGHLEGPREWEDEEIEIVAVIADRLALALMSAQRNKAEDDAIRTREYLRHILSSSPAVTMELRFQDGRAEPTWIGDNVERVLGFPPERFRSSRNFWPDRIHPDDRAHVEQAVGRIRDVGGGEFEYRFELPEGEYRWVQETQLVSERAEDGSPLEIIVSISAIDDRKRAEQALKSSEERFRNMFESHDSIMLLIDKNDGSIVDANAAAASFYGYSPAELRRRSIFDLNELPREAVERRIADATSGVQNLFEFSHRVASGEVRQVEVHSSPIEYQGRRLLFSIIHDVTARRRAEEERRRIETRMRHAQKLESLGVLAGGIAHDFNNLLVGILGNAALAAENAAAGTTQHMLLQRIELAAQHAADLTNQMLAYSGKGRFVVGSVSLSRLITDMTQLIEASVSKKIDVRYELDPELPTVEGDSTQLRQIVLNLLTNASDAIEGETGHIMVSTGTCDLEEHELADLDPGTLASPGAHVYLDVADTGKGMDEVTVARIFDPFFTTRFTGRGLGLAVVQGIVRGHRGAVRVTSHPDEGTRFRVMLPVRVSSVQAQEPAPKPSTLVEPHPCRVLVVDDEPVVREMISMALERAGFDVLQTGNALESVELFQQHAQHLDVVLLDMTLPDLDGEEVFRRIRQIDPSARVLLMSGFSEQDVVDRFTEGYPDGFLQKPYTPSALIEAIQGVVAQR